jgi:hypothetical protein
MVLAVVKFRISIKTKTFSVIGLSRFPPKADLLQRRMSLRLKPLAESGFIEPLEISQHESHECPNHTNSRFRNTVPIFFFTQSHKPAGRQGHKEVQNQAIFLL